MTAFYVICFDVADSKRLRSVANELENHGARVQKSVFECWLTDQELDELKRLLAEIIDFEHDHVRYYGLCPKDIRNVQCDGGVPLTRDSSYHLF